MLSVYVRRDPFLILVFRSFSHDDLIALPHLINFSDKWLLLQHKQNDFWMIFPDLFCSKFWQIHFSQLWANHLPLPLPHPHHVSEPDHPDAHMAL